jgi:hypothetical protein
MIKAELKKKHPPPVLVTLHKALSDAETEVIEEDWSECLDHIKTARRTQHVSTTPSVAIGPSAGHDGRKTSTITVLIDAPSFSRRALRPGIWTI